MKDWSLHTSKTHDKQYYWNSKTNERLWRDDDMLPGWVFVTQGGEKSYFSLSDRNTTTKAKPLIPKVKCDSEAASKARASALFFLDKQSERVQPTSSSSAVGGSAAAIAPIGSQANESADARTNPGASAGTAGRVLNDGNGGADLASRRPRTELRDRRTLNLLLQAMVGLEVSIELKNDVEVQGMLDEVDAVMNCTMMKAVSTRPDGVWHQMGMVFVQGRMIRYVHIPDDVDIHQLLKVHTKRTQLANNMYKRQAITTTNKFGLFRDVNPT